jgi:hypothetical protein
VECNFEKQWVIDRTEPNTNTVHDDEGSCSSSGYYPTTSFTPESGPWKMDCDSSPFDTIQTAVTPNCPTTPKYTYEWSQWSPQQTDDTTCGEVDQRHTREECAAGLGCCTHHQKMRFELQPQERCPAQEGEYPLVLSGVPASCASSWLNGVWQYVGKTADARPYYKQWDAAAGAWQYLYYDKDCDGSGADEQWWLIGSNAPSTTLLQDLNGKGVCDSFIGRTAASTTAILPPSGAWSVSCGGLNTYTLALTNCTTVGNYTYVWDDWAPHMYGSDVETFQSGAKTCSATGCSVVHTFTNISADHARVSVTVEQSGDVNNAGETTSLMIGSTPIPASIESCRAACRTNGFAECLDNTDPHDGSHQMLSCSHACMIRYQAEVGEEECNSHCDRTGSSGCSAVIGGMTFNLCTTCIPKVSHH